MSNTEHLAPCSYFFPSHIVSPSTQTRNVSHPCSLPLLYLPQVLLIPILKYISNPSPSFQLCCVTFTWAPVISSLHPARASSWPFSSQQLSIILWKHQTLALPCVKPFTCCPLNLKCNPNSLWPFTKPWASLPPHSALSPILPASGPSHMTLLLCDLRK